MWTLNDDDSMTVKNKAGNIETKQSFGSVQLHIEWKSPSEIQGSDQHRGNSGVFLQQKYEVQVLDNNDNDTYVNGQVGSLYKRAVPLAKASVKTGEWNTYDIIYHQPLFSKNGEVLRKPIFTVIHNGILIQDYVALDGPTVYIGLPELKKHGNAPLLLQDHGDNSRVSYRNIWIPEITN